MQSNFDDRERNSGRGDFAFHPARQSRIIVGLVAVVASALVGCPGAAPPANPTAARPFAGVALKIRCADAVVENALFTQAAGWAARVGATVERAGGTLLDIDIVPPAQVCASEAFGLPLPEAIQSGDHPGQWFLSLRSARDRLGSWGGVPVAVPLAGDGFVLVYRTDKLAEPALKAAYQTRFGKPLPLPPRTWEDLAEIAEAAAALGRPVLPPLPADAAGLLRDFHFIAACYDRVALMDADLIVKPNSPALDTSGLLAFHHDLDTAAPRLAAPGFVAAAELFARLQPGRGTEDDAALAVRSLRELGRLPKDAKGRVRSEYALASLPGTRQAVDLATKVLGPLTRNKATNYVPYLGTGGWYGVVNKATPQAAAAFDLLAELGGPSRSLALLSDPALGFGPFRQEHLEQAREAVWQRYAFDTDRTKALADALRQSAAVPVANPAVGLRGPDAVELQEILASHVRSAATGTVTPAAAMAAASRAWQERDAKRPPATVKEWRRRAAGLN